MGAANQSKLANLVGVSRKAVTEWLRRPDFPVRHAAPWNDAEVEQIRRWKTTLQEDRSSSSMPGTSPNPQAGAYDPMMRMQIDTLLKREKMLHEKLKREITEGKYMPRDLVDGAMGGLAVLFVQMLDDLELSGPTRFANRTGPQVAKDIGVLLDSYRQRIIEKAQIEMVKIADLARMREEKVRGRGRPTAGSRA